MQNKTLKPIDIKARLDKGHKWRGHILHMYAENIVLHPTKEEDIFKIDMTSRFLKEIEREIMNQEILKIQINSKPRMGKSTVGIYLGMYILDLLKKHFKEHAPKHKYTMNISTSLYI